MTGPMSFSLSKFSYATVSGEYIKPIPWTHISDRGHLFAVFETITIPRYSAGMEEKGQFKVLAGQDMLVRSWLGSPIRW
jgi:hypothetical protein